jgi:hypothetical protein
MRSFLIASAIVLCASIAHADEDEVPSVIRGTGKGYSAPIMIADVSAALVIPATILPTWSNSPWIWSIPLSAAPLVLTGPIMHAAHGRWFAATMSFFGWSAVVASSWAVGGILSMILRPQCETSQFRHTCTTTQDLSALGIGLGVAVGMLGTAGMTTLDGWMARPFKRTHVTPNVSFDAHGATAGLLGSF